MKLQPQRKGCEGNDIKSNITEYSRRPEEYSPDRSVCNGYGGQGIGYHILYGG